MAEERPGDDACDRYWMRRALELAQRAAEVGEVPVGALLLCEGAVIGEGWNQPIGACDPTAHAEVLALRAAAARLGNYRLVNSTLYVTLEPCPMCAGALVHARVARVVFGAWEPKSGAVGSLWDVVRDRRLTHRPEVRGGVLADECVALLEGFFGRQRDLG